MCGIAVFVPPLRPPHILTSPCLQNLQNGLSLMPLVFHIVNPPFYTNFPFDLQSLSDLLAGFANMPNLAYLIPKYFKWLYLCSGQLVTTVVITNPETLE